MTGLLAVLRALGTPNIGELRGLGLDLLKAEVKDRLEGQRLRVLTKAFERMAGDGDDSKLTQQGPFKDRDGVSMTGRQYFTHQALYALIRVVIPSGEVTDVIRDDHFEKWGMSEADLLLTGITEPKEALGAVFTRFIEQYT